MEIEAILAQLAVVIAREHNDAAILSKQLQQQEEVIKTLQARITTLEETSPPVSLLEN